jgi:regulatory protein
MFGERRQVKTESDLYDLAVRALMRRAHSVQEMKQKLERQSDNQLLVETVMTRLKQNGLIDDAHYAEQFVRQRTEVHRQGKFRIARDLRGRGIPDRYIVAAMNEAGERIDEGTMVRQRIQGKLKLLRGEIDERKIASLYRSLLRAGFSPDVIRRELKTVSRTDLTEMESPE